MSSGSEHRAGIAVAARSSPFRTDGACANPEEALKCCYQCTHFGRSCTGCGVDCSAAENLANRFVVSGPYSGNCGSDGFFTCTVYEQSGKVAAVGGKCE